MRRVGLSLDELVVWSSNRRLRYAAHIPGLDVLAGETIALVGTGTHEVLEALADALADSARVDGAAEARDGALRIAAQQARNAGAQAVVVTDPFEGLADGAQAIAVADLAGLASLGLTTIVAVADPHLAALVADRVVVVRDGAVVVGYPVMAQAPRTPADVAPVTERLSARLLAIA